MPHSGKELKVRRSKSRYLLLTPFSKSVLRRGHGCCGGDRALFVQQNDKEQHLRSTVNIPAGFYPPGGGETIRSFPVFWKNREEISLTPKIFVILGAVLLNFPVFRAILMTFPVFYKEKCKNFGASRHTLNIFHILTQNRSRKTGKPRDR